MQQALYETLLSLLHCDRGKAHLGVVLKEHEVHVLSQYSPTDGVLIRDLVWGSE